MPSFCVRKRGSRDTGIECFFLQENFRKGEQQTRGGGDDRMSTPGGFSPRSLSSKNEIHRNAQEGGQLRWNKVRGLQSFSWNTCDCSLHVHPPTPPIHTQRGPRFRREPPPGGGTQPPAGKSIRDTSCPGTVLGAGTQLDAGPGLSPQGSPSPGTPAAAPGPRSRAPGQRRRARLREAARASALAGPRSRRIPLPGDKPPAQPERAGNPESLP